MFTVTRALRENFFRSKKRFFKKLARIRESERVESFQTFKENSHLSPAAFQLITLKCNDERRAEDIYFSFGITISNRREYGVGGGF